MNIVVQRIGARIVDQIERENKATSYQAAKW